MGIAAYNRGTRLIAAQIAADERAPEFAFMDELNAIPKSEFAFKPFGPVHFVASHGGWFAECPITGFGFFFKKLRAAVAEFHVEINAYDNGVWIGAPA